MIMSVYAITMNNNKLEYVSASSRKIAIKKLFGISEKSAKDLNQIIAIKKVS